MKALIFAAGRGERMRPLTDTTPKPLLIAGGKRLIEWQIERLTTAGIVDIVINTAHLAEQFPAQLGDGSRYGARIRYSHEGDEPLETGGGMLHALRLLGPEPFMAINGDIWCDFDLRRLPRAPHALAHLVMVENPPQHPKGDFELAADGRLFSSAADANVQRLTFAGIGVYRPEILANWREIITAHPGAMLTPPRFPLAPLLRAAMAREQITGEHYTGQWFDIGTPARLANLDARLTR